MSLTERLDDAVIEALESEGAGPAAVEELLRLRNSRPRCPPATAPRLFDAPSPAVLRGSANRRSKQARAAALQYHDGLPDFLCTQTVRRYRDPKSKEAWRPLDVLTITVVVLGQRRELQTGGDQRQTRQADASKKSAAPGPKASSAACCIAFPPVIRRRLSLGAMGHAAAPAGPRLHLTDRQPPRPTMRMDYEFEGKPYHLSTAMRGRVYIDRETNQTLRITWEADGLPPDSPIRPHSRGARL